MKNFNVQLRKKKLFHGHMMTVKFRVVNFVTCGMEKKKNNLMYLFLTHMHQAGENCNQLLKPVCVTVPSLPIIKHPVQSLGR